MVQRKEPTKLKPKKTKQASKPESFVDLHGGSPVSKGAAAASSTSNNSQQIKTMKHLPNYMRPTTSSDARRDHCNSPSVTNSSRKSSSPPSVTSKRKSLTLSTPFLKRTKSKVLFQKLSINRATCSSTLKDSKFPKALNLNPSGTESEGTSAVRVCPYTYCSLNGHVHEPVPPLKSFLASKRRLIKTQQSMKLKGFSPFRKREPKRSEKEASPLFQEVVNDFIVEIYASANEKVVDLMMQTEERIAGEDIKSEFSAEEMDAVVKLVEFVSCDQEIIKASTEKCSDLVVVEMAKEEVDFDEKCTKFESFKGFDADVFSDSGSFSSDRSSSHERLFAPKDKSDVEDMDTSVSSESEFHDQAAAAVGMSGEGGEEAKEDPEVNSSGNCCTDSEVICEREEGDDIQSHLISDKSLDLVVDSNGNYNSTEESEVVPERGDEKISEIITSDISENDTKFPVLENINQENEEVGEKETSDISENEIEFPVLENVNQENEEIEEKERDASVQKLDPVTEVEEEVYQKKEEKTNSKEEGADVATPISQMDQLCVAFEKMRIEGEDFSFDPKCQSKNRLIIARRRPVNGEDDFTRGFNPRAPNFLPVEPDPESEKVDLRHQMMDERKNAEEYLLDYALRKAVNQLAPARKKKVELLVAAFETVVPV